MNPAFSVFSIVLIALDHMPLILGLAFVLFFLWLIVSHNNK